MTERVESPGGVQPSMAWLERANRLSLLARLVASTVHDVNNALQVIGGGVELLQMKPADPDAVTRAIGGQAERATRVLQDLSRFARDAGDNIEVIDLRELAEYVLVLRHFALTRLRAKRAVEGDAVSVRAVRRDLLQIVLNLVINAELVLAGRPEPAIRIAIAQGEGLATLTVEDSGPGVLPGERVGLFAQHRASGDGPVERLGIGLAVSQALAERNRGALTYTPREPSGATFTLTLPDSRG